MPRADEPRSIPTELPILVCDLSSLGDPLVLAREAVDELRVSHPRSTPSNARATYQSPWSSHLLNPKLRPLCDSVVTVAKTMAKTSFGVDLEAAPLVVSNCWAVIYEAGDFTRRHNHFPAVFGCAVYLEADEPCTPIVFGENVAIEPRAGQLVLFPGILDHAVPTHAGGRRVVISMNLRLEWGTPQP